MDLPILGYRTIAYNAALNRWESPFRRIQVWQRGTNNASCYNSHPSPQENCECGLYAYHTLSSALNDTLPGAHHLRDEVSLPIIVVACIGYMKVCINSDRWRSQILEPIAILSHEYFSPQLLSLGEQYFNIPFLEFEQFTSYSKEFGTPRFKSNLLPPLIPLPHWIRFTRLEMAHQMEMCNNFIERVEEVRLVKKTFPLSLFKEIKDFSQIFSTPLSPDSIDIYQIHHYLCSRQDQLLSLLSRQRPALSGEFRRCLYLRSKSVRNEEIALRLGYMGSWSSMVENIARESENILRIYQNKEGDPPDLKTPQALLVANSVS